MDPLRQRTLSNDFFSEKALAHAQEKIVRSETKILTHRDDEEGISFCFCNNNE